MMSPLTCAVIGVRLNPWAPHPSQADGSGLGPGLGPALLHAGYLCRRRGAVLEALSCCVFLNMYLFTYLFGCTGS